MKRPVIRGTKKKRITAIATITTLLSATAAFIAIKAKKAHTAKVDLKREEKSKLEIVLDGLVESGTITQTQQVAIQSAITTAIEAGVAKDFPGDDNGEFETIPDSTKTGTLSRLKKSLFEVPQIKEEVI